MGHAPLCSPVLPAFPRAFPNLPVTNALLDLGEDSCGGHWNRKGQGRGGTRNWRNFFFLLISLKERSFQIQKTTDSKFTVKRNCPTKNGEPIYNLKCSSKRRFEGLRKAGNLEVSHVPSRHNAASSLRKRRTKCFAFLDLRNMTDSLILVTGPATGLRIEDPISNDHINFVSYA